MSKVSLERSIDEENTGSFIDILLAGENGESLNHSIITDEDFGRYIDVQENENDRSTKQLFYPAYPNPFNSMTTIPFSLRSDEWVTIQIFDVYGRELEVILDNNLIKGYYTIDWDGALYPSGIYIINFSTPSFSSSQKILLLK